jgi:hypothetical protein
MEITLLLIEPVDKLGYYNYGDQSRTRKIGK